MNFHILVFQKTSTTTTFDLTRLKYQVQRPSTQLHRPSSPLHWFKMVRSNMAASMFMRCVAAAVKVKGLYPSFTGKHYLLSNTIEMYNLKYCRLGLARFRWPF